MAQPWAGLLTSEQFLKMYKPPDYLIEGVLQRGYLYSMTGMTGSGKTAVSLSLAAHIALGRKLAGLEVTQGGVVYLAGENYTDVQQRWAALVQDMDLPKDVPVVFHPGSMNLVANQMFLEEGIEKLLGEVACIIVDTHVAFFTGDNENDNLQQQAFAEQLRVLAKVPGTPAVIVPSHPSKNSRVSTMPRGGGAFLNAVDGNFTVSKKDGQSYTRLHWAEKFRGPPFEPIRFRLLRVDGPMRDSKGKLLPTVLAKPISQAEAQQLDSAASADDMVLLEACRANPTLNYRALAEAVEWFTPAGQPDKDRVFRTMRRLVDAGLCKYTKAKGRYGVPWALSDGTALRGLDLSDVEETDD